MAGDSAGFMTDCERSRQKFLRCTRFGQESGGAAGDPQKSFLTNYGKYPIVSVMKPPKALLRPIIWIASSKDDLSALPGPVKDSFGMRLYELQIGRTPMDMKPLT
jgi:hypothetical protein